MLVSHTQSAGCPDHFVVGTGTAKTQTYIVHYQERTDMREYIVRDVTTTQSEDDCVCDSVVQLFTIFWHYPNIVCVYSRCRWFPFGYYVEC